MLFAPIDVELPDAAELLNHFLAEKPAVDNEPSEVDVKVDAALGDLVRPGTEAAHTRHVRAGEEPCELCKAARSEALSRRRGA